MPCEDLMYEAEAFQEEVDLAESECDDLQATVDMLEAELEEAYTALGHGAGLSGIDIGAACEIASELDEARAQLDEAITYWADALSYVSEAEGAYESCLEECGDWTLDL
jgi:hypothetical protein